MPPSRRPQVVVARRSDGSGRTDGFTAALPVACDGAGAVISSLVLPG